MKMRLRQALDKMRNIRKQLGLSQHAGKVAAVDWSGNGIHIWCQGKCLVTTSPWLHGLQGLALAVNWGSVRTRSRAWRGPSFLVTNIYFENPCEKRRSKCVFEKRDQGSPESCVVVRQ